MTLIFLISVAFILGSNKKLLDFFWDPCHLHVLQKQKCIFFHFFILKWLID